MYFISIFKLTFALLCLFVSSFPFVYAKLIHKQTNQSVLSSVYQQNSFDVLLTEMDEEMHLVGREKNTLTYSFSFVSRGRKKEIPVLSFFLLVNVIQHLVMAWF